MSQSYIPSSHVISHAVRDSRLDAVSLAATDHLTAQAQAAAIHRAFVALAHQSLLSIGGEA